MIDHDLPLASSAPPASVEHPGLLLAMLTDGRLPVGAHTQSGGLEQAVVAGVVEAEVPMYLMARLRTVVVVEAATAVVARHHVLQGRDLGPVMKAWAARTPSGALRENSCAQARGLLRLARTLWSSPADAAGWDSLPPGPCRPVAMGAVAAVAGLDARQLVQWVGYDDCATVASASLKLMPTDPAKPAGWLLATLGEIDELAARLEHLSDPADIPAPSAPLIDHWAEAHHLTRTRMFRA